MSHITKDTYEMVDTIGDQLILDRRYKNCLSGKYDLPPKKGIRAIGDLIYEEQNVSTHTILADFNDSLVRIKHYGTRLEYEVHSPSIKEANAVVKYIRATFPEAPEPLDQEVKVKFWYLTKDGPAYVNRTIPVPKWEDIIGNYSKTTREGLNDLIENFVPEAGGKIILWHGLPGTGKTYALRSLVRQWKDWANVEYILDPEALFGTSPAYLAQMIFSESETVYDPDADEMVPQDKWKVLILEDTGELLSDDARERAGQGLSRLLNLADGFVGQGLRVLILITTNEEVGKMHPAVAREGRCAAAIHFSGLSQADALDWGKRNSVEILEHKNDWTIADLYAKKNTKKIEVVPVKEMIGFRR